MTNIKLAINENTINITSGILEPSVDSADSSRLDFNSS